MDNKNLQPPHQQWIEKYSDYSDEALLAELSSFAVLPDENDPVWDDEQTWTNLGYPYAALARVAGDRRLKEAITLLLEKASYGDPYESMRGLRHSLEKIVNPDWHTLTQICIQVSKSPNRGARLWAINELGILRDKDAFDVLVNALHDDDLIQYEACMALEMLCQNNPDYLTKVESIFTEYLKEKNSDFKMETVREFLANIQKMKTVNSDKIV